jgi:hypothetical protein
MTARRRAQVATVDYRRRREIGSAHSAMGRRRPTNRKKERGGTSTEVRRNSESAPSPARQPDCASGTGAQTFRSRLIWFFPAQLLSGMGLRRHRREGARTQTQVVMGTVGTPGTAITARVHSLNRAGLQSRSRRIQRDPPADAP